MVALGYRGRHDLAHFISSVRKDERSGFGGKMLIYALSLATAIAALLAAYWRLLSRTDELQKSRRNLTPSELHGEKMQDSAAISGFVATILGIVTAALLPRERLDVPDSAVTTAAFVLAILWVAGLVHVLVLWRKHSPVHNPPVKPRLRPPFQRIGSSDQ